MAVDPGKSFRRLVLTGFLVVGGIGWMVVMIVILILAVLIFTHGRVSFT